MNIFLIAKVLVINLVMCDAARILGLVPFNSYSHAKIMFSLFTELTSRGHELTVMSPMSAEDIPANITHIAADVDFSLVYDKSILYKLVDLNPLSHARFNLNIANKLSELTLKSPNVQKFIHTQEKFDLIIIETFCNDAMLGFTHKFNVPYVSVSTFSGTELIKEAVGDPFPYAYVPNPYIKYTDHMSFRQRLDNTIMNFLSKIDYYYYALPTQDAIMRKYFSHLPNLPPLADIVRNASLQLHNTHFSHGFPRPVNPNSIEVGGLHIKPPKKLPKDIQKYLDDAKDGVIYFSMGSGLKSADMSVSKRQAFLNAFAKLKQNVLWKFEVNLDDVPANVRVYKWLPQSDILGHPNLRAFMTHGGCLSSQEAVYNAVPLVGVPVFSDQKLNIYRAVERGYALELNFANITEESVLSTLNEIANNPKYKLVAREVSNIFHDQPQTPMEQAIFWIEYVIRHKGAPHLRSASLDLAWYQLYLLDVVAVLVAIVVIILLSTVWLIKTLIKLLLQKPSTSSKKTN